MAHQEPSQVSFFISLLYVGMDYRKKVEEESEEGGQSIFIHMLSLFDSEGKAGKNRISHICSISISEMATFPIQCY